MKDYQIVLALDRRTVTSERKRPGNGFTIGGTDFCVFEDANVDIAREELADAVRMLGKLKERLAAGDVPGCRELISQLGKACSLALDMIADEPPDEDNPPAAPDLPAGVRRLRPA